MSLSTSVMENDNCTQPLTELLAGDSSPINEKHYKPEPGMLQYENFSSQPPQSTVVTILQDDPPIKDYVLFSVFNIMIANVCCLGFLALVFSVKCRDRKLAGDRHAARSYSATACLLNITTTILTILFFILVSYFVITSLPPLPSLAHNLNAILYGN
ncbi:interferon-induced transmembrane protein 1-like [Pelobates fuscus]|uniref:interferon-induced transmembrane protein 1-like n=1 Tax=Pelobates fuscus TaxID=191477 RepID=UPI002FE45FB4